jgi:integrase
MAKPTRKSGFGKKPRPDFPLFPHANGYWAKKVRQRLHYFGKVADGPDGKAALEKWLDQKDDLLADRTPGAKKDGEGLLVADLVNGFLTHKRSLLDAGEITQGTFGEYYATCERLVNVFGRNAVVACLVADDFQRLRNHISGQWGPIRLGNEIQRVRSVFKFGYESGLLDKPPRFGPGFKKPSAEVLRQNRAKRGLHRFERDELQALLAVAPPILKAMVLLGVNGGLGNADVATLPIKALDLKRGWLTYPRPKTGIERRIPLWAETVEALNAVLTDRRETSDPTHEGLVFIGPRGVSYIAEQSGYRVSATLKVYLKKTDITRPLSFYALRHTFQTLAEGAKDLAAVQSIMGQTPAAGDMSARYRERVDDDRLRTVVDHVHDWLFGDDAAASTSSQVGNEPAASPG